MRTLRYKITFHAPAFLGDAEQNGQWRTPPFKAQLRQWWRVVYFADAIQRGLSFDLARMREEEGLLLGNAWLDDEYRKSLVRVRLDKWSEGVLRKNQWPADVTVTHPEVRSRAGTPVPVGSGLYLGYGPLVYDNQLRTTRLKANAAIQAGELAAFSIAFPDEGIQRLQRALWLMDRYGAVGGRSRNGWGSYGLTPCEESPELTGAVPLRPWRDCLGLDWPHALGNDEKGALIWQTAPHVDWQSLMRTLAIIKIGLRTQFRFTAGKSGGDPEERHWLAYPVTKHSVRRWGNQARLPNQLRFKLRVEKIDPGTLVGVIFHVPHLPPQAFTPDRAAIERVWQRVHAFLDAPAQKLTRIPE